MVPRRGDYIQEVTFMSEEKRNYFQDKDNKFEPKPFGKQSKDDFQIPSRPRLHNYFNREFDIAFTKFKLNNFNKLTPYSSWANFN